MKEDDLDLTDREKEAIEAIGRELDSEFGGADPGADAGRDGGVENLAPAVSPKRRAVAGLHVALAVGTGTLSAAVVMALTTLIAPSGLAPATHEPPPGNLALFGARTGGLPRGTSPVATPGRSDGELGASTRLEKGDPAASPSRWQANRSAGDRQPKRISRRPPVDGRGSHGLAIMSAALGTRPIVQAP